MEFKTPYLLAMRDRAPKMFKELRATGRLEQHLALKAREAKAMFEDLTKDAPKEPGGYPRQPQAREAEEQVLANLIEFPQDETTPA